MSSLFILCSHITFFSTPLKIAAQTLHVPTSPVARTWSKSHFCSTECGDEFFFLVPTVGTIYQPLGLLWWSWSRGLGSSHSRRMRSCHHQLLRRKLLPAHVCCRWSGWWLPSVGLRVLLVKFKDTQFHVTSFQFLFRRWGHCHSIWFVFLSCFHFVAYRFYGLSNPINIPED